MKPPRGIFEGARMECLFGAQWGKRNWKACATCNWFKSPAWDTHEIPLWQNYLQKLQIAIIQWNLLKMLWESVFLFAVFSFLELIEIELQCVSNVELLFIEGGRNLSNRLFIHKDDISMCSSTSGVAQISQIYSLRKEDIFLYQTVEIDQISHFARRTFQNNLKWNQESR